ncbi:MAG: transcriptional regulator [Candidatus Delongbacteria bacterium]|nr:transcriptional regulator [Candidatus Delongbacteria bacterium]MBN2834528.1 transcriptional regulator [Candidatus Delongbacteria bacterium]
MSDPNFDYKKLDDIIHSRIRLAILTALLSAKEGDFNYLKSTVKATDGNLSVHLRKLEDANYISANKTFINRKPNTSYSLTDEGKKAFDEYVKILEKMIRGE